MSEWYKCVVKQEVYQDHYEIMSYDIGMRTECNRVSQQESALIEEKEIYRGLLNTPYLKKGEPLYLPSLNKTVFIFKTVKCLKTFDNGIEIIYYIEPEYIDNKEERIALNEKCKLLNDLTKLKRENAQLRIWQEECSEEANNKFWERFIKGNTGEKHDIKADIDIFNTVLLVVIGLTLVWIAISIV